MKTIEMMNRWVKEYAGIGIISALGLIALLAAAGAAVGFIFPKYQATALLQFPEQAIRASMISEDEIRHEGETVDLSFFKRVSASYLTSNQLKNFFQVYSAKKSAAAQRLLLQTRNLSFWHNAVSPLLPFTKDDLRVYGDIGGRDAMSLLGLNLTVNARTEQMVVDMIGVLADYLTNAMMREHIRTWVLVGKADAIGGGKNVQAKILNSEWTIKLLEQRVIDMKEVLVRYPDAARLDARQVISVNPAKGADRFLSPLAQLVGFESAISRHREQIRRWERALRQNEILATFFTKAEPLIDATVLVQELLPALEHLVVTEVAAIDSDQEWVKEMMFRVNATLDNFSVRLSRYSVRNSVGVSAVASRNPLRLAVLLALLGAVGLAGVAFVRASLRAADADDI